MESAVKTMHGLASDQAAKYRGDMKKVVMMTTVMLFMTKMAIYCPQGSGTLRQQYTLLYSVLLCYVGSAYAYWAH